MSAVVLALCGSARLRIKALIPFTATLRPKGHTAEKHAMPHVQIKLTQAPAQASQAMLSGGSVTALFSGPAISLWGS